MNNLDEQKSRKKVIDRNKLFVFFLFFILFTRNKILVTRSNLMINFDTIADIIIINNCNIFITIVANDFQRDYF